MGRSLLLSLKLATVTTLILLPVSLFLCTWLYGRLSSLKRLALALFALPLVLPPTVLGFYLLIFMSPDGYLGKFSLLFGLDSLVFTFPGLVIGSVIYSLPFVLQPIYNSLSLIDKGYYETSLILGKSKLTTFFKILVPMARNGVITGAILGFLHTVGEFGVILMIGGNIPNVTNVASVHLYDLVEGLNYSQAHTLSFILVFSSVVLLYLVYTLSRPSWVNNND
jgi:molybdate transport system permease protein